MTQRLGHTPWTLARGVIWLLLCAAQLGSAQSLEPGDRVRVIRQGVDRTALIGQFVRSTPDSVWFRPLGQAETVGIELGSGIRLDQSLGRRSRAGTGALIGAGVGAAVTILFLSGFCGGDTLCDGDEQLRAAAIFGLPGLALGAGIGALIRAERWAPVSPVTLRSAPRLQLGIQLGW